MNVGDDAQVWVLGRHVDGAYVVGENYTSPIGVDMVRGAKQEKLYFRRGIMPRVLMHTSDSR